MNLLCPNLEDNQDPGLSLELFHPPLSVTIEFLNVFSARHLQQRPTLVDFDGGSIIQKWTHMAGFPLAVFPSKGGERHSGWIMPAFGTRTSTGTFFQKLG